jgi:hypothetical protein
MGQIWGSHENEWFEVTALVTGSEAGRRVDVKAKGGQRWKVLDSAKTNGYEVEGITGCVTRAETAKEPTGYEVGHFCVHARAHKGLRPVLSKYVKIKHDPKRKPKWCAPMRPGKRINA